MCFRVLLIVCFVLAASTGAGCTMTGSAAPTTSNAAFTTTPIPVSTIQHTPEINSTTIEVTPEVPVPTATAQQPDTAGESDTSGEPDTSGVIGPDDFETGVNPLTGLVVDNPAVLERRPMVVKVSNYPPLVRPQSGIGAADLVFEHYAEGGATRFSAIFYSQSPERVGSIRSARLIDDELMPMYQGILIFSGASIGVDERIYSSEYSEHVYKGVLYGWPYYWRDENLVMPHNMFANTAALWELRAEEGFTRRPLLRGMAFHPDAPAGSTGAANLIDLRYRATRVRWEYEAESGLYYRFSDGVPHLDANTQQQVTAANVIVVYAGHFPTDIVESEYQGNISWSTQITVWPEGEAVLFRDGRRYDGRWVRAVRGDLMSFHTSEGELLYLKPGNSWIQLMPLPEHLNPDAEWMRSE